MTKRLTAVGAYIYAGGFLVGMNERFKTLAHLEGGMFGVETVQANFPSVNAFVDPKEWPLQKLFQAQVDVVYGNPPCQPWSGVGRSISRGKDNWKTDERVDDFRRALSLCTSLQPKIWCMESVPRFWTTGREFADWVIRALLKDGRHVTVFFHDPRILGLPQKRRRVLMIGSRIKLRWSLPKYRPVMLRENFAKGHIRYDPATVHLIDERHRELVRDFKDGENLQQLWRKKYGKRKGCPSFMIGILRWDSVTPTVTSIWSFIHPNRERYMTEYEYARICGFPDDYVWITGGPGYTIAQCALGVSPVAAAHFAEIFYSGIRWGEPAVPGVTFVDFSGGVRVRTCKPRNIVKDISDLYEEAR